jgi:hypothetical protein
MVNFKITLSKEKALLLQNRIVECVTKTSQTHPLYGKLSVWRGALENEYFEIMFLGGVVVVSVEEREMELGKRSVTYAESQSLLDSAELVKGASPELQGSIIQEEYTKVIAKCEQNEITFADIMFILNWQYAEGAKVDEADMLGD